jgi:hypothetical protein
MEHLNEREAAEYLGVQLPVLRRLVERGALKCLPETDRYDLDDLHDYLLSRVQTPEEGVVVMLRRLRWEARELDRRPPPERMELMNVFEPFWAHRAAQFADAGRHLAAESVWAILRALRVRLQRDVTAAATSGRWSRTRPADRQVERRGRGPA